MTVSPASPKWAWRLTSRSSTGPQMATWQYAGVETRSTIGAPAPIAWSSDTAWNGHAGVAVQIGFTPWWFARVGVGMFGRGSPGAGIDGSSEAGATSTVVSTWVLPASATIVHRPVDPNWVRSGK